MADDAHSIPPAAAPIRFTEAEFDLLIETGAAARLGRVELRDGEIWRMSPTYIGHGDMTAAVFDALRTALAGSELRAIAEVTVAFPGYRPTPDVTVFRRSKARRLIPGDDVRLVVEIADATLDDDLGDKRARYAAAGVAEYWVVDMPHRQVRRFEREAAGAGQLREATPIPMAGRCDSLTIPGFCVETGGWPWDEEAQEEQAG